MSVVKASRRGTLDKKPSSGKSGGWQSRYVILEMFEGGTAKISWYEDKKAADKGKKKGDFDLPPSVVVTSDGCAEGFMVSVDKNLLPLRHSLKEQQDMWMESIKAAAAGTLEPSPEEKARAAMQQTSMQDATRKRSATAAESAKIIIVKKKHGILGLTVSDGANGTGCTVISMSPGSQLAHAGLNVGEIIMAEGENMVASRESLIASLNAAGPDDPIELMTAFHSYKLLVDKSVTGPTVGVSLQNAGPSVTVAGMTDGSAALAAGLKIDDVVLAINGKFVNNWSGVPPPATGRRPSPRRVDAQLAPRPHSTAPRATPRRTPPHTTLTRPHPTPLHPTPRHATPRHHAPSPAPVQQTPSRRSNRRSGLWSL